MRGWNDEMGVQREKTVPRKKGRVWREMRGLWWQKRGVKRRMMGQRWYDGQIGEKIKANHVTILHQLKPQGGACQVGELQLLWPHSRRGYGALFVHQSRFNFASAKLFGYSYLRHLYAQNIRHFLRKFWATSVFCFSNSSKWNIFITH